MMKPPKFTAETRAKAAQSAADAKDPAVLAESMNLPQTGEARRLAEAKGSPRIDWEDVLFVRKPAKSP